MAKVNIDFDTKTKEISVTFDGKAVDNVYAVSLSKSYYADDDVETENPFSLNLMTMDSTKQEDEGYRQMQQICASESVEAKEALQAGAAPHPDHPGFLLLRKAAGSLSDKLGKFLKGFRRN